MENYEQQTPVRIPLAVSTNPRDASFNKDALLQNCFIDGSQMGTRYAVKRAGRTLADEPSNVDNARGIFFNPGDSTLYYINDFDTPVEIVL